MSSIDVGRLRERFLRGFFDAWPERDVSADIVRSDLELRISSDDEGPVLVVGLLGRSVSVGFDGSLEAAVDLVDELAERLADDAEGDRWMAGEGWREYRP